MCIFCKIISGEMPCFKIYENEYVLAFLDISHDVDGHTLVIPKQHFINILDCSPEILKEVINGVQIISNHYVNNCGYNGINILNSNNETAQQSVMHLHFHIFPRKTDDNVDAWPKNFVAHYDLQEMQKKLKLQK